MRPLTDGCPKPLLKAGGVPLIDYHLHKLHAIGIREVVINHAWLGNQLEQYVGDGKKYGLKVHFSPEPEGGLETAGGIVRALPLLGSDPFLVVNGDVWSDFDFSLLPTSLNSDLGHLVLVDNPLHHQNGDFLFHNGRILTPRGSEQRLTFAGISVLSPALFAGLDDSFRKLQPLLDKAIRSNKLSAQHFQGAWCDVGTPERLEQLDTYLQTHLADHQGG